MDGSNRTHLEAPGQPAPMPLNVDWPQLVRQAALAVLSEPARRRLGEWHYRSGSVFIVHGFES